MAKNNNEPFSFHEILGAVNAADSPPEPTKVKASDGVELAIRSYCPSEPKAILVFYHGGGAHTGAGYQFLGRGLKAKNIAVYTPDLRGHGASGGPRGDAVSVEQVFRDINTVLDYARAQHSEDIPLFLGGHSSGGGLVVNYASWSERLPVKGYLFLSPQLGYRSNTAKTSNKPEFAIVAIWAFILNGFFGVLGHYKAVRFTYPDYVLKDDPGLVSWNTVNMANAVTPEAPHKQIDNIELPFGIWVGQDDELFLAEKVVAFADGKPNAVGKVVPDENG